GEAVEPVQVGEVGRDRSSADLIGDLLRARLVAVEDDHVGARAGEPDGARPADAAGAPSDQRRTAHQSRLNEHAASALPRWGSANPDQTEPKRRGRGAAMCRAATLTAGPMSAHARLGSARL